MEIERIDPSILNISKKREFTYLDEYSAGKFYPLKSGKRYIIHYWKDKTVTYTDSRGNELRRIDNFPIYDQYVNSKDNLEREKYLKPFRLFLTKKMKEQPTVERYFAKFKFDDGIFEISKDNYSADMTFYDSISLTWQLKGKREHIFKVNQQTLKEKEIEMEGMRNFLKPLEFYREEKEELTPQEITTKKLEKLLHNTHSYTIRQSALNIANALGISGTHQMSDGTWMPGSSHQAYIDAMQQDTVTTPAGSIPTRNITGRTGY
jgi:hypothetical protein